MTSLAVGSVIALSLVATGSGGDPGIATTIASQFHNGLPPGCFLRLTTQPVGGLTSTVTHYGVKRSARFRPVRTRSELGRDIRRADKIDNVKRLRGPTGALWGFVIASSVAVAALWITEGGLTWFAVAVAVLAGVLAGAVL